MHHFRIFLFTLLLLSCSEPVSNPEKKDSTASISTEKKTLADAQTILGNTGLSVQLRSDYLVETQTDSSDSYSVFYLKAIDSTHFKGEAGIYIGNRPNERPPSREYTQSELPGIILGQAVTWIEYKTEKYTQRETFTEIAPGQFLHAWCYANNTKELEGLFEMIGTLNR
jgi:hypothetical protein